MNIKKMNYIGFLGLFVFLVIGNLISYLFVPGDVLYRLVLGSYVSFFIWTRIFNAFFTKNKDLIREIDEATREKNRNKIIQFRKPDGSFLATYNSGKAISFLYAIIAPTNKNRVNEQFTFYLDRVELLAQKVFLPYSELEYLDYRSNFVLIFPFHKVSIRHNGTTYTSEWSGSTDSKSLDSTPGNIGSLFLFLGFEVQGMGSYGRRYIYNSTKKPTGDLTPIPKKGRSFLMGFLIFLLWVLFLFFLIMFFYGLSLARRN